MPSWKPSTLRTLFFRGSDWSFQADDAGFRLSLGARGSIDGPLAMIQAYAHRRLSGFPATDECKFVVSGLKLDRRFAGMKPDEAEAIGQFLEKQWPKSLADCARHGQRVIDEWHSLVECRLQSPTFIDTTELEHLNNAIPPPSTAGLDRWEALFAHPKLSNAREAFPNEFPSLGTPPRTYLASVVDGHNAKAFGLLLNTWVGKITQQMEARGWIGQRERSRLLKAVGTAPDYPGRTWQQSTPAEFHPTAAAWLGRVVSDHNTTHEATQLIAKRPFFERVESNPLTEEQARAVVCMDDELLVVAAAGSGKSSTIVAKAGYALEEGLCEPEEILLLAFNNDAAAELRRRIKHRLGHLPGADRIVAKTFHAFGLEVIGEGTGKMPSPAPWLDHGQDKAFTGKLVDELCAESADFAGSYQLFRLLYIKGMGRWDADDEPEDYDPNSRRKRGFRTMRNEIVKSKSERLIADWLFLHGVNYEYERPYEHDTRTPTKRQYRPDFYYPDIGVYHEHLALDANGEPPPAFEGYAESMEWKRKTHAERGTALFETTSHELRTGKALVALKAMLEEQGMTVTFDENRPIPGRFPDSPESIAKLLRTFQQHMKGSRQSIATARERISRMPDAFVPRMEIFLYLYQQVAERWEQKLQEEGLVDFDDMLNQSADLIDAKRYVCKTKMILADEFQDSSRARMRLVQSVIQATGAQLTAVGDDWQGIYRFAGADIAIMSHFQKQYPAASIRYLSQTFRCPQDICDITSEFVSKNPLQIKKGVKTYNARPGPSVRIFALPDTDDIPGRIRQQLEALHSRLPDVAPEQRLKVLILGRYNNDKPSELAAWQQRLGGRIDLSFLTVHRAKGLEADVVLLVNVIQGRYGFPSQLEDDPILQLAMPDLEAYPFGEERRLFYVALTRAKRSVVIYTTAPQPSQFVVELQNDFDLEIVNVEGVPVEVCPICEKGVVVERVNKKSKEVFNGCSRFPACPPARRESDGQFVAH